jgi:thiosulfate reductase cytochrome b subunit
MLTAFDIHGTYTIFGFEKAVAYHTTAAWTLIGLWVFAIFWHFTTGEWKQYIPTTEKVVAMMKYYLVGIFKNAPHPFKLTTLRKHNPLQRLAYLFILLCVGPLIWVTGVLYLFYDKWAAWGLGGLSLEWVATGHTIGAFMMLAFLIAHVYLTTAGHTPAGPHQGHDHRLGRSRLIPTRPTARSPTMKLANPAAGAILSLSRLASAFAYDADWKRGRVYYRSVCTSCHAVAPIGSINPSTKTKAEWAAYLKADKHAKGKDTVKQYVSKAYRASIKSGNKAAEKFADTPDQELLDDVAAFLNKGAKDGDAPASCS